MTSLLTNTAALSALRTLGMTQLQLSRTEAQVSSGLAVAKASDGAAYWSIAQTMSAQIDGLSAVDQGLALTMSIADVTAAALGSIKSSLDRIQADVVAAQQAGVDLSAVQTDISAQQQSIIAAANSASFNGVNWLINKTSVSQTITDHWTSDVSESDDNEIGLNQESGVDHFTSVRTVVTTAERQDGTTASQTTTSGYHTLIDTTGETFDGNGHSTSGSMIFDPVADPVVTTGNPDLLTAGYAIMPVSQSATGGVITSSFPLAPLSLFGDNTGTITRDLTWQFADQTVVYPQSVATSTTHSYGGDAAALPSGILDQAIPTSGSGPFKQTLLDLDVTSATKSDLAIILRAVRTAITGIVTASTTVGALQTQVSNQLTANSALSDALTSGVSSLVDADMDLASTRLQALQTQQQLGIQALSIANDNSRLILKLFQGA